VRVPRDGRTVEEKDVERERFAELLTRFPKQRVLVLGDFILDEYLIGDTKRVSREAPVVVIDFRESAFHPGGAANAIQNVAALGASAAGCGVIGDDRYGAKLREILTQRGADVSALVTTADISTAVKTRILAGELHAQRQQVARIDRSYRLPRTAPVVETLTRRASDALRDSTVVIVSDYGMGVVPGPVSERVISDSRKKGIPVVVDSRYELTSYVGASVATPNEVELFEAMNVRKRDKPDLLSLARRAIEATRLEGLVITRGSRGMLVCDSRGGAMPLGIVGSSEVADVTGAGDTVAAVVALSLASGGSLNEAAEMATYAASVVVMKRGTATMSAEELLTAREKQPAPSEVAPDAR
jgi:rfaE bifunctional protein kinase chain/domain